MLTIDKETFKKAYENKYKNLHGEEIEDGNNQQRYGSSILRKNQ